jgi:hypothetical protein
MLAVGMVSEIQADPFASGNTNRTRPLPIVTSGRSHVILLDPVVDRDEIATDKTALWKTVHRCSEE